MRWFCTQPDIIEDVHTVRYHTKSSGGTVGAFLSPSSRAASTKTSKRPSGSYNGTVSEGGGNGGRLNMTRTASSTASHGGKKRGISNVNAAPVAAANVNVNVNAAGISGPIPLEHMQHQPARMTFLHSSPPPMIVSTHPGPPPSSREEVERDKSKSLDIAVGGGAGGMVTDSEREGGMPRQLRRKSRRMSAPFAALGIHVGSGTDTDTGTKKRRVSKVMIGAPEGFKHEGHVGMGGSFASSPEVPDSWNVEAWRAEIERTLSSSAPSTAMSRPKGPRPNSTSSPIVPPETATVVPNVTGPPSNPPPRNRYRRSVDGAAPRRSLDGYGGASGAMTDAPTRPGTAPNRARSGSGGNASTGGSSAGGRRSRSGSQSHSQSNHNGAMSAGEHDFGRNRMRGMEHGHSASLGHASGYGHSQAQHRVGHAHSHSQPQPSAHVHGHTLGKDSITSLASIPTSTTASTGALVTPNTTSTSLSRSNSDKPHYPPYYPHDYGRTNYQQQYQQYHQQLAHLGQSHPSYYQTGPGPLGVMKGSAAGSAPGAAANNLYRSSSATAALPPSSTSSSATAASTTSVATSATAYGGVNASTATLTGRKPIPAPRRKPVPQHLPATAEVSPFPTLLVVAGGPGGGAGTGGGAGNNGGSRREVEASKRAPFPFGIDVKAERAKEREREVVADRGLDVGELNGDVGAPPAVPSKVEKELVPLLGVPGEDAHYVTKSTKVRWDGAMAEIANALKEPNAAAAPV